MRILAVVNCMRILAVVAVYLTSAIISVGSISLIVAHLGWSVLALAVLGVGVAMLDGPNQLARRGVHQASAVDEGMTDERLSGRTPTLRLIPGELVETGGGA